MKNTLRCHDPRKLVYGCSGHIDSIPDRGNDARQDRASPQGVAVKIAAGIVARLANTLGIACASLRAIDDFASQRTCISSR